MLDTNRTRLGLVLGLFVFCGTSESVASPGPGDDEFFERRVRPILATHCISCHGPKMQKGGLRLDAEEGFLRGGTSGPVVVEGDAETSLFIEAVEFDSDPKMPPKGKLPANVIDDLKQWVKTGAEWPESEPPPKGPGASGGRSWALRPVADPPRPRVADPSWPKASLDWWVLETLDRNRLKPSPPPIVGR